MAVWPKTPDSILSSEKRPTSTPKRSRVALGPTEPPIQWILRPLSVRKNWPERGAHQSPPSQIEVNKKWSNTSIPHTCLYGMHTEKVNFFFFVGRNTFRDSETSHTKVTWGIKSRRGCNLHEALPNYVVVLQTPRVRYPIFWLLILENEATTRYRNFGKQTPGAGAQYSRRNILTAQLRRPGNSQ
jgi:hypothetical protein